MVITEKQNLQTSQTERRHRRMLERMNRILMAPRLFNRPSPRSEWNSQSQTLRSMDLFGLERDNIEDMDGHPSVVQSLFQSVFNNIRPQPQTLLPDHSVDHDRSVSLPGLRIDCDQSERDVHIIPIAFSHQSNNPIMAQNSRLESHPINFTPNVYESDRDHDSRKVIEECSDINTHTLNGVIDCDTDVTPANAGSEIQVIDSDLTPTPTNGNKNRDVFVVDEHDDMNDIDVDECNTASLVRQSLPQLSLLERSKGHVNKDHPAYNAFSLLGSLNANVFGEGEKPSQNVRVARSNKDTLVGGANKVLGDVGPDGYYKGDNLDIPPGATYLSGHMSTSEDVHSHSDEEKPVNEVPNYPIYSILKKKLMKECRQIDHIKGDGNCFFRALSKQLYGSERYHIVLRNLIVDIIATNKSKFSQFVDDGNVQDHVERMSQEQSWATTCEIYAAATLLQRDIFMLTPDHLNEMYSWLLFKPVFKMDAQHSSIESHPCYITLCNTNGNHYDRIVAEHGGCNCFLPHPELDGVSYSVDLTC